MALLELGGHGRGRTRGRVQFAGGWQPGGGGGLRRVGEE